MKTPKTMYRQFCINAVKLRLVSPADGSECSFETDLEDAAEIYARKFHGRTAWVRLLFDGCDLEDGLAYDRTLVRIYKGTDLAESFLEVSPVVVVGK